MNMRQFPAKLEFWVRSAEEPQGNEHLNVAQLVGLRHVHLLVALRKQNVADEAQECASEHVHHDQRQCVRVPAVRHEGFVHGDQSRGCRDEPKTISDLILNDVDREQ
jgi:hypothetical protein